MVEENKTTTTTILNTNTEPENIIQTPEIPQNITKTIDGTITSDYITRSGIYADSIIDEIIEIDVTLADIFVLSSVKRQFAFFGEVVGGAEQITLKRVDINNYYANLTDEKTKKILSIWFNSGGTQITILNMETLNNDLVVKFDAKNLILAGLYSADQLKAYNMYKINNKRIFLTKKQSDNFDEVVKNRETAIFLVGNTGLPDDDYPVFEYYAKYSQNFYYKKNNFENSKNYIGLKLDSIDYLTSNNIGSLLVIDSNNPSIFYNMVDTAGYDINLSFLKDDLVDKIQENIINTLKVDNSYNQSTINMIDLAIKKSAVYFIDLKRIQAFSQSLIPFKKQEQTDIKQGICKGFILKYVPNTEIKKVKLNLVENIGSLENE